MYLRGGKTRGFSCIGVHFVVVSKIACRVFPVFFFSPPPPNKPEGEKEHRDPGTRRTPPLSSKKHHRATAAAPNISQFPTEIVRLVARFGSADRQILTAATYSKPTHECAERTMALLNHHRFFSRPHQYFKRPKRIKSEPATDLDM